jgi:hypothetical protein
MYDEQAHSACTAHHKAAATRPVRHAQCPASLHLVAALLGAASTLLLQGNAAVLKLTSQHASDSNAAQRPSASDLLGQSFKPVPRVPESVNHDPRLDGLAVLVVGGRNRTDEMEMAFLTWTSVFKHRLFVTDEEPRAGSAYGSHAENLFPGLTEEGMLAEVLAPGRTLEQARGHGEAATHDAGWYISQAKVLRGLDRLVKRYPDASWYVIADSDTFVHPFRLVQALGLLGGRGDPEVPVAFGKAKRTKIGGANGNPASINMLLGGAGVVLSRGAIAAVGLDGCLDREKKDATWAEAPSDHRLGLCLQKVSVKRVNVYHMYQSNEKLTCTHEHGDGGRAAGCAWGAIYSHRFSPCALTLHYQSPRQMATRFRELIANTTVCTPAGNFATDDCVCGPKTDIATWKPMSESWEPSLAGDLKGG